MIKIRPLHDRVYVERLEVQKQTAGGLYIPEGSKEKGQTGKIIAVGNGKHMPQGGFHPLQVKVGDIVFFGKFAGTDVDDKHVLLKEDEILGIID